MLHTVIDIYCLCIYDFQTGAKTPQYIILHSRFNVRVDLSCGSNNNTYLPVDRLGPMEPTTVYANIRPACSESRPSGLLEIEDCIRHGRLLGQCLKNCLEHGCVVDSTPPRHYNVAEWDLLNSNPLPDERVDTAELYEGRAGYLKGTIDVPCFGQHQILHLKWGHEDQMSLIVFLDVGTEEVIGHVCHVELKKHNRLL